MALAATAPVLDGVGLTDLIDADPRPTFVVALPALQSNASVPHHPPSPPSQTPSAVFVYANHAFLSDPLLASVVRPGARDPDFWAWVTGCPTVATTPATSEPGFAYQARYWTRFTVKDTWVVVTSNEQSVRPPLHRRERSDSLLQWSPSNTEPDKESYREFVENFDWAATPLGPVANWPRSLTENFDKILADSRPVAIYWGNKLFTLYNEAFSKICGTKHPSLLGKPLQDVWPTYSKEIMSIRQRKAAPWFVQKADGTSDEVYLEWSVSQLRGEGLAGQSKKVLGLIHHIVDVTFSCLWDRRCKMLIKLGELLTTVRGMDAYWIQTIQVLESVRPDYDIPLAILYSIDEADGADQEPTTCRLEGSLGVPDGHPIAPSVLSLDNDTQGLATALRGAVAKHGTTTLTIGDGSLPKALLGGLEWRGFGDPCSTVIICPIRPTDQGKAKARGLLVLGINPRRPYDKDYQQFIALLSQKVSSTLASTVLLEEEARRARHQEQRAASMKRELKSQLADKKKEMEEYNKKFQSFAEFVPVGLCLGDDAGNISFANDAWHLITGHPRTGPNNTDALLSCVVEEDRMNVTRAYAELESKLTSKAEFRVHRPPDIEVPLQHPIGSSPSLEKAGLDLNVDTGERHVLANLKAERNLDGKIDRVLVCLTDVTLHKRAAEEATKRAQQAENLKDMAELATVGMYDIDPQGRLLWANNVFYDMCGLDKTDLTTNTVRPFLEAVTDESFSTLERTLSSIYAGGAQQTVEIVLRNPWTHVDSSGEVINAPRCVLAAFAPVYDTAGSIRSFTGCLSDVSLQRWQLQREVERKEQAIESKGQQERFIDMTSHEMRNPLSAIIQATDEIASALKKADKLVSQDESSHSKEAALGLHECLDESAKLADVVVSCAKHQERIVDDILTVSRLDSNLLQLTPVTVNPIDVAKETTEMFRIIATQTNTTLTMRVDQSYHNLGIEFLDFDPSRLKQILINLLTNALKFTQSGEAGNVSITMSASKIVPTEYVTSVDFIPPEPPLAARLQSDGAGDDELGDDHVYLMFQVEDTGQGMTAEEMSSLFQRFKQANSKTHLNYGGSGLGLFISRQLTEMQNGAIGVASSPGIGSTFCFFIRTRIPSAESVKEARAAASAAQLASQNPPSEEDSAPNDEIRGVLVVEDNLINQKITVKGLSTNGYKVMVANHGAEALEKLKETDRADGEFPLGMILMDVEMPIMDGLTCTRIIRQLEAEGKLRGPHIPIVAVSANARTEQRMEAINAGCDDTHTKPTRSPALIQKMRAVKHRLAHPPEDQMDVQPDHQSEHQQE